MVIFWMSILCLSAFIVVKILHTPDSESGFPSTEMQQHQFVGYNTATITHFLVAFESALQTFSPASSRCASPQHPPCGFTPSCLSTKMRTKTDSSTRASKQNRCRDMV